MRTFIKVLFATSLLTLTACSTLNESIQLGAGTGALAGAAATYAAKSDLGEDPRFKDVLGGAGIGLVLGLITSNIIHQNVEETRSQNAADATEMHFGDLPPSPFVFPKTSNKGGR